MTRYTEAQKRASIKYMQDKTDDIRLRVPKGTKAAWQAAADKAGSASMTRYVMEAVAERMQRDEQKNS